MLRRDVLQRRPDVGGASSGVSTCSARWLIIPTAIFLLSFPLCGAKLGRSWWLLCFDSIVQTSALMRSRKISSEGS